MATGINSVDDLRAVKYASAAEFGLDTINKVLQADLDYFNGEVTRQLEWLCKPVTEQSMVYGTSAKIEMTEVDEYGVAPSRKNSVGQTVSFPLRLFSSSIGFTSKYLEIATPAELTEKYLQVKKGYAYELNKQIRKAMYNNTNYNFVDRNTNGVTLAVKQFINADSSVIPDSPAGASFDGASHTHFMDEPVISASAVANLVSNVTEHGHTKGVKLVISLTDKASFIALTGFTALSSQVMVYNATDATIERLDNSDLENQKIGYWGDVEVWVKPWAVANYVLCVATDADEKPLAYRQRPQASLQGLRFMPENSAYPLISRSMEAEFGFGVYNRTAGGILYFANATWANPTIS